MNCLSQLLRPSSMRRRWNRYQSWLQCPPALRRFRRKDTLMSGGCMMTEVRPVSCLHYTFLLLLCYDHPKVRQPCTVFWCKASVCVCVFVCNVPPALFLPRACSPPTLPHLAEQALEELQAEDLHWGLFETGQQGQAEVCRWQYSLNEYSDSVVWNLQYNWPNGILGNLWCYKCCTEYLLSGIILYQITIYTQIQPSHACIYRQ